MKTTTNTHFAQFTNLYNLHKTLRFELKPIGKTLDNIQNSGIIKQDEKRAENYTLVKKYIDEYHKKIIDDVLSYFRFSKEELLSYQQALERDDNELKNDNKKKLRKKIATAFKKNESYKKIFSKDLIKEALPNFIEEEDIKDVVKEFDKFTTYFTGFHENRENIYTDEEKSTSICYRIVDDNFPKFVNNINIFEKVKNSLPNENLKELYNHFQEYLNVNCIEDIFKLDYFNFCLSQKDISLYNYIIGGKVEENKEKIKGLNEYINLYNQQQKDKNAKLPRFKTLFKQILSDKESLSWIIDSYKDDQSLIKAIKKFKDNLFKDNIIKQIQDLLLKISTCDLCKIYIKNDSATICNISAKLFDDFSIINHSIRSYYEATNPKEKNENFEKYNERITKIIKQHNSFSISELNNFLNQSNISNNVEDYFKHLGLKVCDKEDNINLFQRLKNTEDAISTILQDEYVLQKELKQDGNTISIIKSYLDSLIDILHFIKPLCGSGEEMGKDHNFYSKFDELFETLKDIILLYNMVRNYITQKPYSTDKIKINFENSTLLNGWDLNKERDNTAVILEKDNQYYLGIMNKSHNRIFESCNIPNYTDSNYYKKMEYKLLPEPNKNLPRVFLTSTKGKDTFKPNDEICRIYDNGTFKKGTSFNLNDCHKLIDYFKASISQHTDWKNFNFDFSPTKDYQDISQFYREVENQGYKIRFREIPESYINTQIENGALYLFRIYNKDFSLDKKSTGTPNLHTLYWKALFSKDNFKDVVFKLNGKAEVFFRPKSLEKKITHPKGIAVNNKNILNGKKEKIFDYDLIKNKRYTEDKFHFHVPITLNFNSKNISDINYLVRNYIKNCDNIHFIGIDRGERHLLYVSIIDSKGKIIDGGQFSFNIIENEYKGNSYKTDYHDLLNKKEKERDEQQKSWQTIENIKELKQGYLSQVVHKISQLIIKYNAIVVMEDLNMGFKQQRQKFEKSVYQQFEKALIDKLNYLVDKKKEPNEIGGLYKAFQLANQFSSFKKMGKQNGFIFYIPAWNTSKIDPVTGFANFFRCKYENISNSQTFFNTFKSIIFNKKSGLFEFSFDYKDFSDIAGKVEGTKTYWTIASYGERIETLRDPHNANQWVNKTIDITKEYKSLFEKYKIDFENLKEGICEQNDKEFFIQLLHLFHLTLQMRNSITNSEVDYIISPVVNTNGSFFDSRNNDATLPMNADANGAYNIARKGLMLAKQIRDCDDINKIKFSVSNKDWLKFVQEKPYLDD